VSTWRRDTVADLLAQLLALDERIGSVEHQIRTAFNAHPQAAIIESMPGTGPSLGAELIAAAGDLNGYANPGRLASAAGLVPVPPAFRADAHRDLVVVTHEIGFARSAADPVVFMDGGVVVERGVPAEVIMSPRHARTRAFIESVL
jgi:ABC-type polar amino acid transport system, ATPase component